MLLLDYNLILKPCSKNIKNLFFSFTVLPYEAVGCFKDDVVRSIETLEGNPKVSKILTGHYKTRKTPVQKCYQAAKALNFKVFAVQDGGQCMSSATALKSYKNYGKSEACVSEKGGPMANYVWKIKSGKLIFCACLYLKIRSVIEQIYIL